jgi:hypothetical protein
MARPEAQVFVATHSGDPLRASKSLESHTRVRAGVHARTHTALVQVKFTLEHATTARRRSKSIAPLFL